MFCDYPYIYDGAKIVGEDCLELGGYNVEIGDFCFVYAKQKTVLGDYSAIHSGTCIVGSGELIMGRASVITYNCTIVSEYPNTTARMSTRVSREEKDNVLGTIEIGDECFIGSNSVIMPDVKIGDGAVVAALSYVDEDVEPWTIRYPDGSTKPRPKNIHEDG